MSTTTTATKGAAAEAPHEKFIEILRKTGHFSKEALGVIGKAAIEAGLVVVASESGVGGFDIETGKFNRKLQ